MTRVPAVSCPTVRVADQTSVWAEASGGAASRAAKAMRKTARVRSARADREAERVCRERRPSHVSRSVPAGAAARPSRAGRRDRSRSRARAGAVENSGREVEPRLGSARLGSARLGSARLGSARLGSARLGSARLGSARLGSARLGSARLGSARLGSARLGSARLGSAQSSQLKTRAGCQVFCRAVHTVFLARGRADRRNRARRRTPAGAAARCRSGRSSTPRPCTAR